MEVYEVGLVNSDEICVCYWEGCPYENNGECHQYAIELIVLLLY